MRIGFCGDSWTEGYGIDDKKDVWTHQLASKLDSECIVKARSGADNKTITNQCERMLANYELDILFVGWSGITRIIDDKLHFYKQFSLSYVPEEATLNRQRWFESHSLDFIFDKWYQEIEKLSKLANKTNTRLITFSVFGDKLPVSHPNLLTVSFLEYLSKLQGHTFSYDIPIFEFDFLYKDNEVTDTFCNKYLDKDWKLACAEREEIRPGEYFLECGHPNSKGHLTWANFLYENII